jgi:hypothetical protein
MNSAAADDLKSCDVRFTVHVSSSPISVDIRNDLLINGLGAGQTVPYVPDGTGGFLSPAFVYAQEADIPALIRVHGDPNSHVIVTFSLPSVLFSDSRTGMVYLDYNGTSATWGAPGVVSRYFNPRIPEDVNLDGEGDCDISLGCIATASLDAVADSYTAEAIVTVAYTVN